MRAARKGIVSARVSKRRTTVIKRMPGVGRYAPALMASPDMKQFMGDEERKPRKAFVQNLKGYKPASYVARRKHKRTEEADLLEKEDPRLDKMTMLLDRDIEYQVERSDKKKLVTIKEVDRAGP